MTAVSAPRPGWELLAGQVNQRRYEAPRAYLVQGAPLQQAADAPGYTRDALASLVRDLRAGRLTVFAPPGTPGRKSAPKKDAARGRVIELRRDGLSAYEISTRLTQEGTPLGRTAVSDILREEGFGRLLRGPAPEASASPATSGRDTRLPAAGVIDFAALPARAHTTMAGLLLAIPDLVALDLALEKHYVPARSQRARSVLTFFAQDTGTHNLVYANADLTKATQNREVIAFCDHWKAVSGSDPTMLIMDQKVTTQAILGELDG